MTGTIAPIHSGLGNGKPLQDVFHKNQTKLQTITPLFGGVLMGIMFSIIKSIKHLSKAIASLTFMTLMLFSSHNYGQNHLDTNYDRFQKPRISTPTIDWFNRNQDSYTTTLISNVEKFHLSQDNFFQNFRDQWYFGALDHLQYVLSFFPNHPKALMLFSTISRIINKPTLPLPYYQRALQYFPQHAITHFQYGKYLMNINKIDEGISALKHAVTIDSDLGIAHAALAEAYYKNGDIDQAKKEVKKARELGYKGEIKGFS